MEENKNIIENQSEESSIDFVAIWKAILKHRKLYFKVLPVTFIIMCIYTLSLPNYYKCVVTLAPELGGKGGSGSGLAALASSFGVNIGGGNAAGDAITPMLYPNLMNSVDFKTSLFDVKVQRKDDKAPMTYYDYLMNEQKRPWWSGFFGLMKREKAEEEPVNTFELTQAQESVAKSIAAKVLCSVDKKTNVIMIEVTDQDPRIAAMMADTVKTRLQDFLTKYRTNKARHDLAYIEDLQRQAKKAYERARQLYVDYMDSNQNMILLSAMQKQADLENEMQLQYNNYNALNAQVIDAKARVQEVTPAFTTLQSATVPLRKDGPKRSLIVLGFLFLATLLTTAWALYKEDQLKPLLGLN
ncbi:Chain length determinant protein [Xylanibacter ruminicola]|uniref:Chain length determinant protein n=2 Tax=Xylanibacter ruminicola TaxID=839 RepID=A0A1H5V6K3_XYLRU|nr:Chain length determinant protein [Xylanibacter ruminicola]